MKVVGAYALACVLLLLVSVMVLAPWLGPSRREGLVTAGVVALALQVGSFAVLVGARKRTNRFLAAWVGGTLARFAAVGLVAWMVFLRGEPDPLTTLLGLAGYLFGMLLLEPVFFPTESGAETSNGRR
jgi:hypothetical protein